MTELQYKFFSHAKINQVLRFIALECSSPKTDSAYIKFDKSRYVRMKPLIKCLLKGIFWKSDKLGILLSLSFNTRVKIVYMILFYRNIVVFSSDAEIIQIRNHISVFYLQLGVRVKSFIEGGAREKNDLLNEWETRKNILCKHSKVRIPNVIKLINNRNITCYTDEIVYGELVNWFDKKSDKVMKLLIEIMFSHFRASGISWLPFNEIHPVATKKYCILLNLRRTQVSRVKIFSIKRLFAHQSTAILHLAM